MRLPTKLAVAAAMLCVACVLIPACSEEYPKPAGEVKTADEIDDGANKYWPMQRKCPVCGGQPIQADYHAELNGKRVYFDKQECVEEFKEDKAKYEEELKQQLMQDVMGVGGQQQQEEGSGQ